MSQEVILKSQNGYSIWYFFLKWLKKQIRCPASWLLLLTVINWIYYWNLGRGDCHGVYNPWYCDWTWYNLPHRLFIAALCLRCRPIVLKILGALCATHILAAQLIFLFNPFQFSIIRSMAPDDVPITLKIALEIFLNNELAQGIISFLLVVYALVRLARYASHNHCWTFLKYAANIGVVFLIIGYSSNFISYKKAEQQIAGWMLQDIFKTTTIYGDCTETEGITFYMESASRFSHAGAIVKIIDCAEMPKAPWGTIVNSLFVGPFFISSDYSAYTASGKDYGGSCLTFNFFGYTKILDRDNFLWRKMLPYALIY
jgi:hypothetical protein